jgi:hypothetical protein
LKRSCRRWEPPVPLPHSLGRAASVTWRQRMPALSQFVPPGHVLLVSPSSVVSVIAPATIAPVNAACAAHGWAEFSQCLLLNWMSVGHLRPLTGGGQWVDSRQVAPLVAMLAGNLLGWPHYSLLALLPPPFVCVAFARVQSPLLPRRALLLEQSPSRWLHLLMSRHPCLQPGLAQGV